MYSRLVSANSRMDNGQNSSGTLADSNGSPIGKVVTAFTLTMLLIAEK
jgi:hypothetical protein